MKTKTKAKPKAKAKAKKLTYSQVKAMVMTLNEADRRVIRDALAESLVPGWRRR